MVPIQPAGSRPPVFAVPGLGGIVVAFNNLAMLLGSDQPFYGLQPRGLDGRLAPFETVEVMAEHYLAEVRTVQPHGPYRLVGVCMGGLVAFEMAQRLRAEGEEVAFLALLDVRPPQPLRRWLPARRQRGNRFGRSSIGCDASSPSPPPAIPCRGRGASSTGRS